MPDSILTIQVKECTIKLYIFSQIDAAINAPARPRGWFFSPPPTTDETMTEQEILLVYDKQCPVCDSYCRVVRVRADAGDLKLVDARHSSEVMREITSRGWDIDQGMVLKMGGRLYYGPDAIHALALIGSRSGFFNRMNYLAFSSRLLSGLLYPVLRFFRNLLLKILGKTKINNLSRSNNDYF